MKERAVSGMGAKFGVEVDIVVEELFIGGGGTEVIEAKRETNSIKDDTDIIGGRIVVHIIFDDDEPVVGVPFMGEFGDTGGDALKTATEGSEEI